VIAGLQRKITLRGEIKRRIAYHEGGHALVASLQEDTEPVHKVSIIPTAKGALGYTMQMPEEDTYLLSEGSLRQRMVVMLGGRAAELLVFKEASTGAANDLERVTDLARRMVTEFGMSEVLGPVRYANPAGMGYLQDRLGMRPEISPETSRLIDQETRRLVEGAQEHALELLDMNRAALDEVARILQKHEVINGEEIVRIVEEMAPEAA
jgi:cell division protease FtsH